jgi:hypothetical protein
LGVALLQFEGEGKGWLPVGFASRKMKGAEPRYRTTKKEFLAIVFGLIKFRHILRGEHFEVIILPSHGCYPYGNPKKSSRDGSWRFKLSRSRYFTIEEMENLWRFQTH